MKLGYVINSFLLAVNMLVPVSLISQEKPSLAARLGGEGFQDTVKDAKNKVFPSLVFIKVIREEFRDGKKSSMAVSGSGVIITDSGEVLSNWHVVNKSVEIRCLLFDGTACNAKIIGTDKDTDLALLQLELPEDKKKVPFAEIGDSVNLTEGDFVMAMGAPWGLSRSISIGIISCTKRYLVGTSEYSLWLQTDASISPGNSGGPLIDTNGKVVGINTRGVMQGGTVGFSIPSETINHIVPRLRKFGEANWSWTGINLQPLRDFMKNIYFDVDEGVIVSGTDQDSPAKKAGLMSRDRIIQINGDRVTAKTEEELPKIRLLLGLLPVNKPVKFIVMRDGKKKELEITPREKGKVEGDELDCPRWDLTVKSINQFDTPDLYFHKKNGVFIYGVKRPGNASMARLMPKDIILKVGKKKVESLEDLKKIHAESLKNIKRNPKILFTVYRNGLMQQMVLDISRNFERD